MRTLVLISLCALVMGFAGPVSGSAATTITPTTFTDDNTVNGNCTLREAVRAANEDAAVDACPAGADTDTISLLGGTYTLSIGPILEQNAAGGDLDVTESVTIAGVGTSLTSINGGGVERVLDVAASAEVSLVDLTVTGGVTMDGGEHGGGIYSEGILNLTRVHVTGNRTGASGQGGGIFLQVGATANLNITDSAVTNNRSGASGGGIGDAGNATTLVNVTVSGNVAAKFGGGIDFNGTTLTMNNVTITENTGAETDAGDGGGIYLGGTSMVRNTLIANNTVPNGGSPDCNQGGTVISQGHNLVEDDSSCEEWDGPGDITGQDPKLGPLADNGGATPTHALLPGSPAIDAGGADCASTDQRGAPRSACDIGAYELVVCKGVTVNRVGTGGDDALVGTAGVDAFLAQGGNDSVKGQGGNDTACLGDGNDKASGGGGKDLLLGEAGKDKLKGQGGKDKLKGGPGKDTCLGGGGKDKATCEDEKKIP